MNDATVQFTVYLSIHAGKFPEFERTARTMCVRSQQEPGTLAYTWYLGDDGRTCRLVELYADSTAAATHLAGPVVRELVPKLLESASVTRFEVNGDPGAEATAVLKGFGAEIFRHWLGLTR